MGGVRVLRRLNQQPSEHQRVNDDDDEEEEEPETVT